MAETNVNDQALADARREVDSLRAEVASLKSKTTDETLAGLRKSAEDSKAGLTEANATIATRDKTIADLNIQLETVRESSKALEARAEKADADLKVAQDELGKVKAAETKRSRLALLREKGADTAVAEKLADKLFSLDDAAFAETVDTVAAQWKAPKPKTETVIAAVNHAKPEPDPALVTASEAVAETSHATIVDFLGKSLQSARVGRPSAFATATEE